MLDIDLEVLHLREIEHDAAVGGAVTGGTVASATDGELQPTLACERDDARDVSRVRYPHDYRRVAVIAAVEDGARLVVAVVFRCDHPPVDDGTELRDRDGCRVGLWRR